MINIIVPQYFSIGPLQIHYYGVFMALAVAAGYWLALKRAPKYGINQIEADKIIFWLVVGGFIGARLYHILSSAGYYWQNPVDILKVWNGGLSIYGAVLGGLVALLLYRKILHLTSYTLYLNWLTPSLILGQIIGRFGNFFNYELYGYPTGMPWKMFVPPQFRLQGYEYFNYFHPLFLYEILGNLLIFILLLRFAGRPRGTTLFLWYLLLYNALRFFLEFLRIDSTLLGNFRVNAFVSLGLVIVATVLIVRQKYDKVPQNNLSNN